MTPSSPHPIADLRALLSQRTRLELSPIELAEILWLALQKGGVVREEQQSERSPETSLDTASGLTQEAPPENEAEAEAEVQERSATAAVVTEPPQPAEERAGGTQGSKAQPAGTALPMKVPAAIALRNRRQIARSLRPLMRKEPSKLRLAIDEALTVLQIAETQTWSPVVKPEPERWLELAIVIEVTNLLEVWRDTIAEFQQLMERHGAFRDVRTWQLKPNAAGDPQLFLQTASGLNRSARSPRELLDASGRRLIVLLSDCTSTAWRSGKIPKLLEMWSRENPVTIVQLLPERYWDRSALKLGYPMALRSRLPGALSRDWVIEGLSPRRRQRLPKGLRLPVVTMQPESLGQWARAIAAIGEQRTTGIVIAPEVFHSQDSHNLPVEPLTAKQLVRRFRGTASAEAQELADMMAVLPVNWSVIRLIQKNLVQQSENPLLETAALYLAEIFLSGLLRPVLTDAEPDQSRESRQQYDFVEGVRDLLLGTIPISEAQEVGEAIAAAVFKQLPLEVQQRVSADIERRFGESLSYFEAFLIPDLPWGEDAAAEILPFARVTGQVLRRWGGDYAALAEMLEHLPSPSESLPSADILVEQCLAQRSDDIKDLIADRFAEAEHEFSLDSSIRDSFEELEQITLAYEEPIAVSIISLLGVLEQNPGFINLVNVASSASQATTEEVLFELSVEICFTVEIHHFNSETSEILFPDRDNDFPTFSELIPNQIVRATASICLGLLDNEIELEDLRVDQPILITRRGTSDLPTLREFEFEVATIAINAPSEPTIQLQPFTFEIATLEKRQTGRPTEWTIAKARGEARQFIEDLGNGLGLEMVAIPAGEFVMGSPKNELDRSPSEGPQHRVQVDAFLIGKYPITQAQWRVVAALPQVNRKLDADPSRFKSSDRPVERVSWLDAVEFCDRLSQATGRRYRLPSEAEWEYACRAGTTTSFHFGETIATELANYNGKYTYGEGTKGVYREETTPVGSFGVANAFGLFDMHGNIYEWCLDHWHNSYEGAPQDGKAWLDNGDRRDRPRVLRGGSWNSNPRHCRSACRNYTDAVNRDNDLGFRVVCVSAWTL